MLKINLDSLLAIDNAHGLASSDFAKYQDQAEKLLMKIDQRKQGFYKVIDDQQLLTDVESFANEVEGKYQDIVILGIGGSALGTICLQQSLKHLFENQLANGQPKLHVLDNIDPALIKEIDDVIDYQKTLFIVVTKSGGTPETLSQYFYFRQRCETQNLPAKDHFVFITDPERGLLREIANEEEIKAFEVPQDVGGRFSVLTAVGLVPAKLIGIDIRGLIAGAQRMRDQFLNPNLAENLPLKMAIIQYELAQKGKVMNVMMPYSQRLIRFADWYRQLLAESIGKAKNDAGELVNVGITPINALGATDQHSQSQLYNEGPNDKFFIFIEVAKMAAKLPIPNLKPNHQSVEFLKNVDFEELIKIEKKATENSYVENNRPSITIQIPEVNAESLGELFLLFEGATAFLGELFGIDAFDQPGVELSKILTKKFLLER